MGARVGVRRRVRRSRRGGAKRGGSAPPPRSSRDSSETETEAPRDDGGGGRVLRVRTETRAGGCDRGRGAAAALSIPASRGGRLAAARASPPPPREGCRVASAAEGRSAPSRSVVASVSSRAGSGSSLDAALADALAPLWCDGNPAVDARLREALDADSRADDAAVAAARRRKTRSRRRRRVDRDRVGVGDDASAGSPRAPVRERSICGGGRVRDARVAAAPDRAPAALPALLLRARAHDDAERENRGEWKTRRLDDGSRLRARRSRDASRGGVRRGASTRRACLVRALAPLAAPADGGGSGGGDSSSSSSASFSFLRPGGSSRTLALARHLWSSSPKSGVITAARFLVSARRWNARGRRVSPRL